MPSLTASALFAKQTQSMEFGNIFMGRRTAMHSVELARNQLQGYHCLWGDSGRILTPKATGGSPKFLYFLCELTPRLPDGSLSTKKSLKFRFGCKVLTGRSFRNELSFRASVRGNAVLCTTASLKPKDDPSNIPGVSSVGIIVHEDEPEVRPVDEHVLVQTDLGPATSFHPMLAVCSNKTYSFEIYVRVPEGTQHLPHLEFREIHYAQGSVEWEGFESVECTRTPLARSVFGKRRVLNPSSRKRTKKKKKVTQSIRRTPSEPGTAVRNYPAHLLTAEEISNRAYLQALREQSREPPVRADPHGLDSLSEEELVAKSTRRRSKQTKKRKKRQPSTGMEDEDDEELDELPEPRQSRKKKKKRNHIRFHIEEDEPEDELDRALELEDLASRNLERAAAASSYSSDSDLEMGFRSHSSSSESATTAALGSVDSDGMQGVRSMDASSTEDQDYQDRIVKPLQRRISGIFLDTPPAEDPQQQQPPEHQDRPVLKPTTLAGFPDLQDGPPNLVSGPRWLQPLQVGNSLLPSEDPQHQHHHPSHQPPPTRDASSPADSNVFATPQQPRLLSRSRQNSLSYRSPPQSSGSLGSLFDPQGPDPGSSRSGYLHSHKTDSPFLQPVHPPSSRRSSIFDPFSSPGPLPSPLHSVAGSIDGPPQPWQPSPTEPSFLTSLTGDGGPNFPPPSPSFTPSHSPPIPAGEWIWDQVDSSGLPRNPVDASNDEAVEYRWERELVASKAPAPTSLWFDGPMLSNGFGFNSRD